MRAKMANLNWPLWMGLNQLCTGQGGKIRLLMWRLWTPFRLHWFATPPPPPVTPSPQLTVGNWQNPLNLASRRASPLSSSLWNPLVPGTSVPSMRSKSWGVPRHGTMGRRSQWKCKDFFRSFQLHWCGAIAPFLITGWPPPQTLCDLHITRVYFSEPALSTQNCPILACFKKYMFHFLRPKRFPIPPLDGGPQCLIHIKLC